MEITHFDNDASREFMAVLRTIQEIRKRLEGTKDRSDRVIFAAWLRCAESNPQAFIDNHYSFDNHVLCNWKHDKKGKPTHCDCLLPGMKLYAATLHQQGHERAMRYLEKQPNPRRD